MKTGGTIKILGMIISLLLVAITAASGEKEAVLDSLGRPVETDTPYLIRVDYGIHIDVVDEGWVSRYALPFFPCPKDVMVDRNIPDYAIFSFVSLLSLPDVLRVSTEFQIYFRPSNKRCWDSGYWRVVDGLVLKGGGPDVNNTIFTIEKRGGSYRFAFKGAEIGVRSFGGPLVLSLEAARPASFRRLNVSFVR
ncbi:unnamed protein product [Eruca vesicaria subsp. sativa]|uniref:Uncharacterized protein n=1 Tax=Eruca vesicaria subsp. sativa TaxID=29727 RepID=A0ABC8JDW6_ERUVS|nr:unnamed protein product [Eruca vesicaria subsp. sativa]